MSLTVKVLSKRLNRFLCRKQSLKLCLLPACLLLLKDGENLQVVLRQVLKALEEGWDGHLIFYFKLLGRALLLLFGRVAKHGHDTAILIIRGEANVEHLRPGDLIPTATVAAGKLQLRVTLLQLGRRHHLPLLLLGLGQALEVCGGAGAGGDASGGGSRIIIT